MPDSVAGRLTPVSAVRTVITTLSVTVQRGGRKGRTVPSQIPHLRRHRSRTTAVVRPDRRPVGPGPRGFCLGGGALPLTETTTTAAPAQGRPSRIAARFAARRA